MSDKGLEAFMQAILDDNNLQEQLKTGINERDIESSSQFADLAVEIAGERGYEFSRDEARVSIDKMITAGQRGAELTPEELDQVAGGIDSSYSVQPSLNVSLVQNLRVDKLRILP